MGVPPTATFVLTAEEPLLNQEVTVLPENVIVFVSAASNQRTQPDTLSGLKYGVRKIGIPYFSNYQIKPRPYRAANTL